MGTYRNIDHELELKIRRGFTSDLKKFKALKGWLDGAFKQMVMHSESTMYSFKSRVKQVESLLSKLDGKIADEKSEGTKRVVWENIDSYDLLKEKMDDLVGGRLICYFISDLPKIHDYLRKFKRFFIEEVTIHDMKDNPVLIRPILKGVEIMDHDADYIMDAIDSGDTKIKFKVNCEAEHFHGESHSIPYQIRMNTNGYVGVHMVIKPLTYDDYWKNEPGLYGKFELQTRSLIHEAWAEIQHKIVYKGERMPEIVKKAKASHLEGISQILSACEKALYTAAKKSNK